MDLKPESMIERGALAIKAIVDLHNSMDHTSRYSTPEEIMEGYRVQVRAVIEAMREPTDEMMVEAEDAVPVLECFSEKEGSPSFLAWQAMIDAALSTSEKPR